MRQEQISRTDRAKQARSSERRRLEHSGAAQTAGLGTRQDRLSRGGGGAADVDEELLERICMLIDASATAASPT